MSLRPIMLVLSVSVVVPAAAQRSSESHQWALLLQQAADRVEIDTAPIHTVNGIIQVWLRWSAGTGVPHHIAVYSIELREIDCHQERTRVLRREVLAGGDSSRAATEGSEVGSYRPSSGSLLALATAAACRVTKQAGA